MKTLLLSLVGASLTVTAIAQTPATPAAPPAPATTAPAAAAPKAKPLSVTDKKFVKDASEAILLEQKYLALLTEQKRGLLSESLQRDFKKMDGDLKRIWTALETLGTMKTAELTNEISKTDLTNIDKLSKEKPDKFDKEIFKDLGKETKKTVKLFDSFKTLQDPDVKKFAEDWATVVKGHDLAAASGERAFLKKK